MAYECYFIFISKCESCWIKFGLLNIFLQSGQRDAFGYWFKIIYSIDMILNIGGGGLEKLLNSAKPYSVIPDNLCSNKDYSLLFKFYINNNNYIHSCYQCLNVFVMVS